MSSQPADSLELQTDPVLVITNKQRQTEAKNAELQQWKDMSVYQKVNDVGQECISLRWVMKEKPDGEGGMVCKARLCVRGFEEEKNFSR